MYSVLRYVVEVELETNKVRVDAIVWYEMHVSSALRRIVHM